ncbi:MAG TPA: 50S ribosomal protein L35 [Planctomicrobium sp.]|nr:50S ribosomal protein L35 [Planctomicrobium sp.]
MPKAKTHKGIAKRFKVTGSGKKATHRAANRGHILGKKSAKRKRQLRGGGIVCGANARMVVEAIRPSL